MAAEDHKSHMYMANYACVSEPELQLDSTCCPLAKLTSAAIYGVLHTNIHNITFCDTSLSIFFGVVLINSQPLG